MNESYNLPHGLPPAEVTDLRLGFMRLTDSAPLILAKEEGLFARFGLNVQLCREVSWANLRDKLVVGDLDAAQLLAPLPVATNLGIGGIRGKLLTGLVLSRNGNAITLSRSVWDQLGLRHQPGVMPDARQVAEALGRHVLQGRGTPLHLATVHAFSMHSFMLRRWLSLGGLDLQRDVRMLVLPPEQMCDSLARGLIDGFCVGEPWSSVAVDQGIGVVASSGYQLWNNAPEKVLAVSEAWHQRHPASHLRLRMALMEACRMLADPQGRAWVAELLSCREYLNLPSHVLLPSLTGQYRFAKTVAAASLPGFHHFWRYQAGFPWRSQGQWMVAQTLALLDKSLEAEQGAALAQEIWRTDLYREAARHLGLPSPLRDHKPEDAHDEPWTDEGGLELGPDRRL